MPPSGNWKENWYQTTGQGGGVSTADFILATLPETKTNGSVLHALGVWGPWQLIKLDKSNNELYPSPVYWGLRTLREGFLSDVLETTPNILKSNSYSGGYNARVIAMKEENKISLLGINRSTEPTIIHVQWLGSPPQSNESTMRFTTGKETDDNDDNNKKKVIMQTHVLQNAPNKSNSYLCVPANSVFSVVF